MGEREPVTSFWGGSSNFAPVEVDLDAKTYPSVEHAYQAAKTTQRVGAQTDPGVRDAGAGEEGDARGAGSGGLDR